MSVQVRKELSKGETIMPMYKNYFFDLYGTLVDIRTDEQKPSLWCDLAEFYSLCGASYTLDEIRDRYFALCAEETASLAAACPMLSTEEVEIELRNVFRRLFEEKGVAVSETQITDTAMLFRSLSFCSAPKLMEGAEKTLKELRRRGARLYLLSNAQSCFTIPELRRLNLLNGVFDGIFLSSDFGVKKPAPAFFHAALEKAGLRSSEVLMVGNDPFADIRGADSIGMKSRYIHSWQSPPRGFSLPESCQEIKSLEELLEQGEQGDGPFVSAPSAPLQMNKGTETKGPSPVCRVCLELKKIEHALSVCKVRDISDIDLTTDFYFIGKTDEELSLVCRTEDIPEKTIERDDGWRGFRIQGVLDFSLIGILSKISGILAKHKIGIFAVSTYNTDYILVKEENFERALRALAAEGYVVV